MGEIGAMAMEADAPLFFDEEGDGGIESPRVCPWKVMVVDDDRDVHQLTGMLLRKFQFEDRGIEIVSGYSGEEARTLMVRNPDTAVVLLDVVMESDHAGLGVVSYIREELKNTKVRIILRTGQPGSAPELEVVTRYDINDYREKTELTQEKLITAVVAALRSFRDLTTIEKNRIGLEAVVDATGALFGLRSEAGLIDCVLKRFADISGLDGEVSGFVARGEGGGWLIYAGSGLFATMTGQDPEGGGVSQTVRAMVSSARQLGSGFVNENRYVTVFSGYDRAINIFYFQGHRNFTALDCDLFQIFMANVELALRNLHLNQEIFESQRDIAFTLGELIEARSSECGSHVRRVAESARLLGQKAGLSAEDVEWLWLAAPLHDLGKVVIGDRLLQHVGPLKDSDWELIRKHTTAGFQILKGSKRKVLRIAATVAFQHHERWDGKGYPQGLRGDEINRLARIVSLVDVFDALSNDRVYRKAWPREQVLSFMKEARGTRFDPALVDLFFANLAEFLTIQDGIPDKEG